MVTARYPFTKIGKNPLGEIYRPYARVEFARSSREEGVLAEAVIDTGADYTILPHEYIFVLGIDLQNDCLKQKTQGMGGSMTSYLLKGGLWLRIGEWKKKIPAAFSESKDIPPLLGRLGCLELFRLIFQHRVTYFADPHYAPRR